MYLTKELIYQKNFEKIIGSSINIDGTLFDIEYEWKVGYDIRYGRSYGWESQTAYDVTIKFTTSTQLLMQLMGESGIFKQNLYDIYKEFRAFILKEIQTKLKYPYSMHFKPGNGKDEIISFKLYGASKKYRHMYPSYLQTCSSTEDTSTTTTPFGYGTWSST